MTHEEILEIINVELDKFIPIGTIQCFAMQNIPSVGVWMECDGRTLDRTQYQQLFDCINNTFGGDETYFNIPDIRGQFVRGFDSSGVIDRLRVFGSCQNSALQGHKHKFQLESEHVSNSGTHNHELCVDYHTVSGVGLTDAHYIYDGFWGGTSIKHTRDDGSHTHQLPRMSVGAVESSSHGAVNIARETRPTNIALMFCIRVL